MAPKKTITEYERRRLENIRRNSEMIASLRLHSKASELSASLKRGHPKPFVSPGNVNKKLKSPPGSPIVIRRSLRTRGLPPEHSCDPSTLHDASKASPSPNPNLIPEHRPLIDAIVAAAKGEGSGSGEPRSELAVRGRFDPRSAMVLKSENVAKVVPERILSVKFLPSANRTVLAVGNKLGNVGFWDLDQIFTCSYDGLVRMMDVEKEIFQLVYSSTDSIYSICQFSCDANSLYFGEGAGVLKLWDERTGKASSSWELHRDRINTIDFHPENKDMMVTSSTDGTASIWDLRNIKNDQPKQVKLFQHQRAVHSAYFSPTGSYLATTSIDDSIGILGGSNLNDIFMVPHNNQTGRWLSAFRAVWGWDDCFLFIGNMKRAVDIISTERVESPEMTSIPCRFAAHPCKIGTLAGATAGGKVFILTET
ncbi:Protein damaged DNA-binding 2 [Apostasia shenzhenica]|uniref:Protein damaged DNA-binding 2 n=1 Tax=Apostasia shenzhenica TaxID=1088818 RepID=A0A2I0B3U4_9ASPA|nr:Protein damaged DNA-binding 2 [Apostasia shenzhenica]